MKNLFNSLLVALSILGVSCSEHELIVSTFEDGVCAFVENENDEAGIITKLEREILDECSKNALTSKEEIKSNLIGDWQLIGYGNGSVFNLSQPCSFISIREDELTLSYTDSFMDSTEIYSWDIEMVDNPIVGPRLGIVFSDFTIGRIFIDHFCDEYMFADHTPIDGAMHLYQKVRR